MNKVVVIGNLVRDVECSTYGKGKDKGKVANFCLAVNRKYKDENGEYPTDFLNFTAFGGQATFLEEYTEKGCKICVEGELRNNNYEDETGNMVYKDQIIITNVELLKHPEDVDKKKRK